MLTFDLPVDRKYSTKFWPMVFKKTHTHKFWEILFITKGSLINSLNKQETELKLYDVVLIHPKDIHYLRPIPNKDAEYYNITISEETFKNFCDNIYEGLIDELETKENLQITLSAHRHNKILSLIKAAISKTDREEYNKYHNIALSILLPEFIQINPNENLSAVAKAIQLMSHPNNMHLSVKDIANQIGYTPEHLTRLFKKEGEEQPSKLFLSLKLQQACILLTESDLSIREIAKFIGFSNLPHFYKVFNNEYNTSPIVYRNAHLKQS